MHIYIYIYIYSRVKYYLNTSNIVWILYTSQCEIFCKRIKIYRVNKSCHPELDVHTDWKKKSEILEGKKWNLEKLPETIRSEQRCNIVSVILSGAEERWKTNFKALKLKPSSGFLLINRFSRRSERRGGGAEREGGGAWKIKIFQISRWYAAR